VNDLAYDIIIGTNFLSANAFSCDYKNHIIKIESKTMKKTDKLIFEQLILPSELSVQNDQLENILDDYKSRVDENKPIIDEKFHLPLNEDEIVSQKCYPVSHNLRDRMHDEIKSLLDKNIIRRSNSLFSTPCFVITKRNGKTRLINDYRQLNSISMEIEYYFPSIMEAFDKLRGNTFFSKIDLEKGFYQLSIAKEDRYKTAFATPFGKFEFNRMPFGLTNAPKVFNNIIYKTLSVLKNIIVFVDDILIYNNNYDDHLRQIKRVLELLSNENIIINFEKSTFLCRSIDYLGFKIDSESYKPDLERLEKLKQWKTT